VLELFREAQAFLSEEAADSNEAKPLLAQPGVSQGDAFSMSIATGRVEVRAVLEDQQSIDKLIDALNAAKAFVPAAKGADR
jgi:hypothetical protein